MCEAPAQPLAVYDPAPMPERLRLAERLPELATLPDWFVYSCPWCPADVVDANSLAVQIMERHLDRHVAAGDHERPGLRVVA
jgi:hypothetical protein